MNHQQTKILKKCYELEQSFSESEPEKWETWLLRDWQEQVEHGPTYKVGEWFGPLPERDRVGYRRCIKKLEEQGLLTTWRRWGDRMTNVKLTEAGRAEIERLAGLATGSKDEPVVVGIRKC